MGFFGDPRFAGAEPFYHRALLSSPTMHGDEHRWVDEAMQTNWASAVGQNVDAAEQEMDGYLGIDNAAALSCGTAALHLAVKLAGEKLYGAPRVGHGTLEGRRVFASDMTFGASDNPVACEGGECVYSTRSTALGIWTQRLWSGRLRPARMSGSSSWRTSTARRGGLTRSELWRMRTGP